MSKSAQAVAADAKTKKEKLLIPTEHNKKMLGLLGMIGQAAAGLGFAMSKATEPYLKLEELVGALADTKGAHTVLTEQVNTHAQSGMQLGTKAQGELARAQGKIFLALSTPRPDDLLTNHGWVDALECELKLAYESIHGSIHSSKQGTRNLTTIISDLQVESTTDTTKDDAIEINTAATKNLHAGDGLLVLMQGIIDSLLFDNKKILRRVVHELEHSNGHATKAVAALAKASAISSPVQAELNTILVDAENGVAPLVRAISRASKASEMDENSPAFKKIVQEAYDITLSSHTGGKASRKAVEALVKDAGTAKDAVEAAVAAADTALNSGHEPLALLKKVLASLDSKATVTASGQPLILSKGDSKAMGPAASTGVEFRERVAP